MNNQYMTTRPTSPAAFGYGAAAPTYSGEGHVHHGSHHQQQQQGQPSPLQPQRGPAPFQGMSPPNTYQQSGPMQPVKLAQINPQQNYNLSGGMGSSNMNNMDRQNGAAPMPQQGFPQHSFPPNQQQQQQQQLRPVAGSMQQNQQVAQSQHHHQGSQHQPSPMQHSNQPGFANRMPAVRPFAPPQAVGRVGQGQPQQQQQQLVNQMANVSLGDQQRPLGDPYQQQRPLGPPASSGFFSPGGQAAPTSNKPPVQQGSGVTANSDQLNSPSHVAQPFQPQPMSSIQTSRSQQVGGPLPASVHQQQQQQRYNNYGGPPVATQQQQQQPPPPISQPQQHTDMQPLPPPVQNSTVAHPSYFSPVATGGAQNMPSTGSYVPGASTYESMNGQPGPGMHQPGYGGRPPPQMVPNQFGAAGSPYQEQTLPPLAPPSGQPPPGPVHPPGFNQGYQRMAPAAPMPMQPPQQQQRRLDPDMMPSPIQVIEDDRKNREGVFSTSERGAVPPLVTTNFVTEDQGNCNPRFMRSSMYSVPNSPDMMKQSSIPFTVTISPFARLADGEVPPPLVNLGDTGPVRCVRCKAYMCPFMQFIDGGRRFQCNFCRATTDVPPEYFSHLDHTGHRVDRYERPELCLGSYELVATKDYCKNNTFPRPPAFIFIIDVSYNSVRSGVVHLLCQNIKDVLAALPRQPDDEESQVKVGFITYSSSVHFYNLKSCLAQPQAMVVPDVQDMFVPLLDGFLVGLRESESLIDSLVEQIPIMYQDCRDTEIILGPAIKAGLEALKAVDCAGKLFVFHSSLPIADAPGKLKNRDDRKLLGTDKEKTILAPQNTFYNQLGQDCVAAACSVDLFTFPNAYIDIATIGQVCRLTGGQMHKYTYFQVESDGPRFIDDLRRSISRQVAFDGIMRIRTSAGIRPTDFYGNYFMSNTTDVELAAMDSDKAICVEIKHDDKLNEEDAVYIQAAILYTSVGGQRLLRIHNLSLNTCSQMADLYRNCELDALMNYYSKASLRKLCDQSPKQVREDLISKCATSLSCYRKNCANPSSAGQLILPECMKLLPLYGNCLLKSDAIAGGSDMATDDRSFAMHALNSMDVASSLNYIYPKLIPVHDLDPNSSKVPTALRCSVEKIKENGAYLLENGVYMFLWIGVNIEPEWVVSVFGVQSVAHIDIDKTSLLEFDNPTSQRLRRVVNQIREERPRCLKLMIVRQRDKLEVVFKHFLVEDKGMDNSPSYVDFLCHVHKEIRNLLS